MRFVPKKSIEQQDIQALHRARQRMVSHRTAVVSQIRGLLLDRGIAFTKSITRARRMIPEILTDEENELTALAREAIGELHDLLRDLDLRIASFDKKIERVFRASEDCQRIARIKGVGPKTATAVIAAIGAIGDGTEFKNGRHLAAWVGLVPRQHSSGQRTVLLGISKRASKHLRSLLVHGARSVVRTAAGKTDPFNTWVNQLHRRRGFNRATGAVRKELMCRRWASPPAKYSFATCYDEPPQQPGSPHRQRSRNISISSVPDRIAGSGLASLTYCLRVSGFGPSLEMIQQFGYATSNEYRRSKPNEERLRPIAPAALRKLYRRIVSSHNHADAIRQRQTV